MPYPDPALPPSSYHGPAPLHQALPLSPRMLAMHLLSEHLAFGIHFCDVVEQILQIGLQFRQVGTVLGAPHWVQGEHCLVGVHVE